MFCAAGDLHIKDLFLRALSQEGQKSGDYSMGTGNVRVQGLGEVLPEGRSEKPFSVSWKRQRKYSTALKKCC